MKIAFGDFDDNANSGVLNANPHKRKNRKGIIIYITTCGSGASGERA